MNNYSGLGLLSGLQANSTIYSGLFAGPARRPVFSQENGEWRWQIKARNGRIIDASTESYKNKKDCVKNFLQVMATMNAYAEEILKEL